MWLFLLLFKLKLGEQKGRGVWFNGLLSHDEVGRGWIQQGNKKQKNQKKGKNMKRED